MRHQAHVSCEHGELWCSKDVAVVGVGIPKFPGPDE